MPRKPRFFLADVPAHIVQRGHNKSPVFFEDSDYQAYLRWLGEAAERYGCAIHAYVLMNNHIHILATPASREGIGLMMQATGRRYVPYINQKYNTSGSLWEGRYKASLVQDEHYLLTCMRYIELNPVRAGMVKSSAHHRWSSYRANVQGKDNPLVTIHPEYKRLGRNSAQRCAAYRELFKGHVEAEDLNDIRSAWQTGTPLGNDRFRDKIEEKLKCKVGYSRRGRPKRLEPDEDGVDTDTLPLKGI